MTQRGRTRNAGLTDSNIAETVPLPIAPSWVTGRFYAGCHHAQSLGTLQPGTNAYLTPIIVPHVVTATAIGIEVSSAGGAGTLERLAVYNDRDGVPYELQVDAGTVAGDASGFQSAVISLVLQAGIYWLALANKTVTSAATVRAYQTQTSHSFSQATLMVPAGTGAAYLLIQNNPAAGGIVDTGWMRFAAGSDGNALFTNTANSPRIMLGV